MSKDQAIRSALCFIWEEIGGDIPLEHKPEVFVTLYGILEDVVENAVRQELGKRWVLDLLNEVSLN